MPLDTSRTPANGMIPSTFPAPDAPVARNSLNVPSNEVFSNILARLPIDPSCRNGEVSKDLFNLRLVSRRVMDAATDVLKAATQQPKCVHYRKIVLPKDRLSVLFDILASNGSTLKGFATHLEIRTYRTLPASLTLAKFEEHIENAMIAEFEDGELEELYDMNRTRDLAQKELAYRLSPPLRRRFRSSLLRCLSDSFTVSMVQEYLSSTQEYNWLELAPFTIDPDEEDLPANSDMGTFAMILPLLPYDKVSNVDMNTLSDIHELLETNVKLRSLTISLSEKELVFWRKLWAPFFHRLPALETLRIEDHSGLEDRAKFTKIVQDACLPRLVTLVIDSLLFNSQKLLDFLYLHKSTLKEVKLVGAYEIDGQSLRSFLYAARARAWTRQFAWTITESHGPWSASFIHAFQGFIFTNLSIPKHPRDVGRYLM